MDTPMANGPAVFDSQDASDIAGIDMHTTVIPETPANSTLRQSTPIANEMDLERFASLPIPERNLTTPLRYVLVEVALTGVIRYSWSLLRPLLEYLLEKTLQEYEAGNNSDAPGPSRPAFIGEDLATTIDRFKGYLNRFTQAPWTLQRLCEVLLAPRTQYTKLHKVALAVEKCLLVTSETAPTTNPPPPPYCEDLSRPVNINPAHQDHRGHAQGGSAAAAAPADLESSAAFTHSLLDIHGSPPGLGNTVITGNATASAAADQSAGGPAGSGSAAAASMNGPTNGHEQQQQQQQQPQGAPATGNQQAHHHHHVTHVTHHAAHVTHITHLGSHGQGSPGAGITPQEHMEEDHWPDASMVRSGLGVAPPLHGLAGHHHHHTTNTSGHLPATSLAVSTGNYKAGIAGAGASTSPRAAAAAAAAAAVAVAGLQQAHHHAENGNEGAVVNDLSTSPRSSSVEPKALDMSSATDNGSAAFMDQHQQRQEHAVTDTSKPQPAQTSSSGLQQQPEHQGDNNQASAQQEDIVMPDADAGAPVAALSGVQNASGSSAQNGPQGTGTNGPVPMEQD